MCSLVLKMELPEAIEINNEVTAACLWRLGVSCEKANLPGITSLSEMLMAADLVRQSNQVGTAPKVIRVVADARLIAAVYAIEQYGGLLSLANAMGPETRQG
jgi:hypothetical protein